MGMPVGPSSPEQAQAWQAVGQAQSPQEYMAAAQRAGLTGDAAGLAAGGAAPIPVPSFEEQLQAYAEKNDALEKQLAGLGAQFSAALATLQGQLAGVQASVPQKVDPVTESAGKVAQSFKSLAATDAKNILHSALSSHFVALGLSELAKLL